MYIIFFFFIFFLMIRLPPRSTRTDTLFPYTTLFRSPDAEQLVRGRRGGAALMSGFYLMHRGWQEADIFAREEYSRRDAWVWLIEACCFRLTDNENLAFASNVSGTVMRSEERRVGNEGVSTFRSRWSPYP